MKFMDSLSFIFFKSNDDLFCNTFEKKSDNIFSSISSKEQEKIS